MGDAPRARLTKQAAARAAASASSAAAIGMIARSTPFFSTGACNAVWNVSHSETKPLNGGSAEIATQPMRNISAVTGMR